MKQRPMDAVAFGDTMASELQKYWPDLAIATAKSWMWEYAVSYNLGKSKWTKEAAADLAREYVSEFGEAP
jgi:hypothetical protein